MDDFYPLRFWFCENAQSAIPLVALQYHDVELRITWGANFTALGVTTAECWADFIYLDTTEREQLAVAPQNMLIYQVQKAVASQSKIQELNFNHPIKFLASSDDMTDAAPTTQIKMQINGVDIGDQKTVVPHYSNVTTFYHTSFSNRGLTGDTNTINLIPFCLDTNKLQPTGSLNFSRLDSARIVSDSGIFDQIIYGVNYNILRIENGMGGLMYAN